jgi:hypothetical protein
VVPALLTVVALGAGLWVLSKVDFGAVAPKNDAGKQEEVPPAVAERPAATAANVARTARRANSDIPSSGAAKDADVVTKLVGPSLQVAPAGLEAAYSAPSARSEQAPLPSVPGVAGVEDAPAALAPLLPPRTLVASETNKIYSRDDSDVQPPTMRYPQLPAPLLISSSGSDLVNRMEILVAADGSVERVRLVGIPARMPDMMLLSGAKLWRFSPALKDGEPVRYRTFVTWSGFP